MFLSKAAEIVQADSDDSLFISLEDSMQKAEAYKTLKDTMLSWLDPTFITDPLLFADGWRQDNDLVYWRKDNVAVYKHQNYYVLLVGIERIRISTMGQLRSLPVLLEGAL